MTKVDLHIHTDGSDGTWNVEELKEKIIEKEISIFAITDHDEVENIAKMETIITPKDNLEFIHGVEATTTYNGKEYHLTLYRYDKKNTELKNFLDWTRDHRLEFNNDFIKHMAKFHDNVTYEDFLNYKEDKSRGGWKSANYLLDKKIHHDMGEHFNDIGKSGLSIEFKGPEEVVKICKKSGGYLFLAHPSYHYRDSFMPIEELKFWTELGIDGVECFTPYNTKGSDYYVDFCNKNNLMISGGSDCHGEFIKSRKLGEPAIYLSDLRIDKLLK